MILEYMQILNTLCPTHTH